MDDAVREYIDGIDAGHRPLFDRLHRLILAEHPDADLVISYKIPAYKVGRRSLFVGAWKHGLSLYGWPQERGEDFLARHPGLKTSKATIQLRPQDAEAISDEEFRDLFRLALSP